MNPIQITFFALGVAALSLTACSRQAPDERIDVEPLPNPKAELIARAGAPCIRWHGQPSS